MNPNENHVDWTAAATPGAERMGSGPVLKTPPAPETKRSVMDALLGKNDLAAFDAAGFDPYNATGRQFRR